MGIEVGDKKVKKIMVGDKVIYQDSDGWIPLELGGEVEGMAFFKANGDGTCQLAGAISANISKDDSNPTLGIYAPNGYEFTQVNWNTSSYSTSILATFGFGKGSSGVSGPVFVKIIDGNLYFTNPNTNTSIITVRFTQSATDKGSLLASPALLGITQVWEEKI